MKELGRALTYLRIEKGLSQREVAEAVGISREQVSGYERGVTQVISPVMLGAFARVLDGDQAELARIAGYTVAPARRTSLEAMVRAAMPPEIKPGEERFVALVVPRLVDALREWMEEMARQPAVAAARDDDEGTRLRRASGQ